MSDFLSDFLSDESLLELADFVLESAGYAVMRLSTSDMTASIAENDNNIVIVAALVSPEDLVEAEPVVARQLTEKLVARDVGAKKWDAYVVLLSAQRASDDQTESLANLANNLRRVRRVIRVGVEPTRAAVSRALRLLLPLPEPPTERAIADPLELMRERLLIDGVDPNVVQTALEVFRLEQQNSPLVAYGADDEPSSWEPGNEL